MAELTPPQNIHAERAVLGAVLISPPAYAVARGLISDDDWYRPAHELIWRAMNALTERGEAIDALTVAAELDGMQQMSKVGGHSYLAELVTGVMTAVNVEWHAALIAETAIRRRFIESLTRMVQMAYETSGAMSELLLEAQLQLDVVGGMNSTGEIPGLDSWRDFLGKHAGQPQNWVVPGLIGRKDVWLVLAPPGAGKSTLSRHICWALAAGVNPFRMERHVAAKRTLVVDLENDEGMTADESVDFFGRFDSLGHGTADRGMIWAHPQGMNILDPKDAHLLDQVLTHAKPDLVALGSLNNAYIRKGDWDQAASGVRSVINRLRVKHQCAFWIEHHMPKGSDGHRKHSPFGSQIFEAWPSHGRVLERMGDDHRAPFSFTAPFRGDRGRRDTPVGFVRGGQYPWMAIYDQFELDRLAQEHQ